MRELRTTVVGGPAPRDSYEPVLRSVVKVEALEVSRLEGSEYGQGWLLPRACFGASLMPVPGLGSFGLRSLGITTANLGANARQRPPVSEITVHVQGGGWQSLRKPLELP